MQAALSRITSERKDLEKRKAMREEMDRLLILSDNHRGRPKLGERMSEFCGLINASDPSKAEAVLEAARREATPNLDELRDDTSLKRRVKKCESYEKSAKEPYRLELATRIRQEALAELAAQKAEADFLAQLKENKGQGPLPIAETQLNSILSDLTDYTNSGLSQAQVAAIRVFTADTYKIINPAIAN
jgi:hypothetical protein